MHSGRHYSIKEVLYWTRREIFVLILIACVPTIFYAVLGCSWLSLPWVPIALVGTAVAFIIGFKNNASYDRLWEARKIWGAIVNTSRSWGIMSKDFVTNEFREEDLPEEEINTISKRLIYRHIAWLTALRYQLRETRPWENLNRVYNREYAHAYTIPEHNNDLQEQLAKHLDADELQYIMSKKNKATQLISLQSKELKKLMDQGLIDSFRHMELEKLLTDLYTQQGKCERIKNFPYPRQFATINLYFVRLFIILVPFGMLKEFEKLGAGYVWLTIPFSALVCWVFHTMEKIGEATENPFEGTANDIPMAALSRTIEIDLKDMLDEKDLPQPITPQNNILM